MHIVVDKIVKHVAQRLRAARIAKGLTQEALAEQLGMATESISHVERAVTVPGLKMIAAACEALDISVADVFAGLSDDRRVSTRRSEQEAVLHRLARELDDRKLALAVELLDAVERYE